MRKDALVLAAILLTAGLSACTSAADTGASAPWSAPQTAYVELAAYQAAQGAALSAAQAPGLSAKDVAEIQAAEATSTAALTAALGDNGDLQTQVIDALVSAAPAAVNGLTTVLAAQHGTDSPDAAALAINGAIGALGQAPEVILAIEKVRAGWQPSSADLAEALLEVQRLHQQVHGLAPKEA